jgi:cell division protein FtsI/penicillin-binding protein 2
MNSNKLKISFAGLLFLFVLIIGKAFYIQVLNKDKLIQYSNSQFLRKTTIHPRRGSIYDRNMNPLAINVETYSIFVIPKGKKNISNKLKQLDNILNKKDFTKNYKKVKKRNKFTWLYRKVKISENQKNKIKKIKDIFIEQSPKRIYPNNELLSQTLGFVGVDNEGLSGLEYQFNAGLQGKEQVVKYFRDAKGRPVKLKSVDQGTKPIDLVLSIDKEIQALSEKHLKNAVEKHKALKAGFVVMDPLNGEILAMANYPNFDPNKIKNSKNKKLSIITDPFEPGSTFKVVTIASALENKIVRPDTNYYCEKGKLKVGNHTIKEAESKEKFEWLSVGEILKYSSNIGTTKIAFDLTYPKLKKTIDKFHFGKKTGIELSGESRGIYRSDQKNVKPLELSNISFGQGIGTTALQMVTFYASLANGGYLVTPTILKKTKKVKLTNKVLSDEIVSQINEMLVKAVDEGTGSNAKINFVKIAGKTSTAQKSVNGKYSEYVGGFIGYTVNTRKKFVIYTYVDSPQKGGYYGNIVAAPIFKKIAQSLLFKNKEFGNLANTQNIEHKQANFDKILIKQSAINRGIKKGAMPDFIGLDKNSARKLATRLAINIRFLGFGIVKDQSPKKGTAINKTMQAKLIFAPPSYD